MMFSITAKVWKNGKSFVEAYSYYIDIMADIIVMNNTPIEYYHKLKSLPILPSNYESIFDNEEYDDYIITNESIMKNDDEYLIAVSFSLFLAIKEVSSSSLSRMNERWSPTSSLPNHNLRFCFLCNQKYSDTHFPISLSCGHFFAQPCINIWRKLSPRCPICHIITNDHLRRHKLM